MPSTVISTINYDPATTTLRITYVSGMIYDYQKVPESIYEAIKSSGAKGIFLNKHIKGKYAFVKIGN